MARAKLLSVLIPARNEVFLAQTIDNVLENMRGDTEIIAVCDGYWPMPVIKDHPRVHLVHFSESIGQRAATNVAARVSQAKFVMKLDAHCAVDEGFDVKMTETFEYDWTVILRMYNLHAFDWLCEDGHRRYQGPEGPCDKCGKPTKMDMIWKPRLSRRTDFARFDKELHFNYWSKYERRPEAQGDIADVMCHVGACWAMHRDRYWELGGMDEATGGWGQMGVEVSCKTWLSGGRQVVNKNTWFSHMFRTQGGTFGFPYPLSGRDVDHARKYSQDMWRNNKWDKQVRDLSWLIDKFAPVPDWE